MGISLKTLTRYWVRARSHGTEVVCSCVAQILIPRLPVKPILLDALVAQVEPMLLGAFVAQVEIILLDALVA